MNILFILGAALVAGLIFTRVMKFVGLPNVTGYLIAGLLIGPYCLNLMTEESLDVISIITTVALGFIAFSIGSSFKLEHLKEIGGAVVVITYFQAFAALAFVDVAVYIATKDLALSLVLGAIATATAPAATLMVVRQYKARGKVTSTLLPVVAFDDAIGLMFFSISLAIAQVLVSGTDLTLKATVLEPLLEIVLSLVSGGVIGFILAKVSKFFKSRANRITLIIAAVLLGLALSDAFNLSNLLICMMIGAIYANAFDENEKPLDVLDRWTYPLYMLFFVISGAELDLKVIPLVGVVGVVYILARSLGKYFGALLGGEIVHADHNVKKYLGLTLLPQAGVAIGMSQIVVTDLPEYAAQVSTIVLCATLIYELIGPVITKIALAKAGEIDKENLKKASIFRKKKKAENKG